MNNGVGERLKVLRDSLAVKNQTKFAEKLGITQTSLSKYENETVDIPDEIKIKLSELNVNLHWLLTGKGEMFLLNHYKFEFTPRIRQLRELLSLDQAEFAKKMGISCGSLIDFERGGAIPSDFIEKLQEKFSVNYEWFWKGVGEPFYYQTGNIQKRKSVPIYAESELPKGAFVVPLLDQRLSAGNGSYMPEEDEVKAHIRVPAYLSSYGSNIAALTVEGDSMYPTFSRGDMVVCDSCGWSGEGIYGLRMSGEGFVKRLTKAPGKIVIISDNPKYPTREEPEESEDIQIIGRVHCAIKKVE